MSFNGIFWLIHIPATIGWIALLLPIGDFRPRRRLAMSCAAAVAAVYVILFFSGSEATILVQDYSLSGVAAFLDIPRLQLAGCAHYLVLDLWAGIWEAEEAEHSGMSRWPLAANLIITSLVGPAGLLFFLGSRSVGGRAAAAAEAQG